MDHKVPSEGDEDNGGVLLVVLVVELTDSDDPYHDGWLDRGYAEREARGQELAAAGFVP